MHTANAKNRERVDFDVEVKVLIARVVVTKNVIVGDRDMLATSLLEDKPSFENPYSIQTSLEGQCFWVEKQR